MTLEEFQKADLRIARILRAERITGSEKLLKLDVALGSEERQILASIGKTYGPEALVGKEIVIVANLEPRIFTLQQGSGQVELESRGMLLAVSSEDGLPTLLVPEKEVEPGSKIK